MSGYTKRRFGLFLLMGCVIGVILVGLTTWSVYVFFPTRKVTVYYQLVNYDSKTRTSKPTPHPWARINYTFIILDDNVTRSILTVTALEEPPHPNFAFWESRGYNFINYTVTIGISFGQYAELVPRLIDGNLSWSGKEMHANQSKILQATLGFDSDGEYRIYGGVEYICYYQTAEGNISYRSEGYGTRFYVTVEGGKIVKVTDEFGKTPPSTQVEAEKLEEL